MGGAARSKGVIFDGFDEYGSFLLHVGGGRDGSNARSEKNSVSRRRRASEALWRASRKRSTKHPAKSVLASEHKMNYVPGSSMNFFDREVYTSIQHGIVWQYLARGGPLDFATRSLDLCGVPANVSSIDVASPEHLLHSGVWSVEFMYSCVHAAGHGAFFLSAADTCNARCLETHSLALHNYTMSSTKLDSAQRMCLDLPDAPSRLTIRGACLGGVYHSFILYRKDWSSSKWARPLGLPQVDQILEKSMHRRTEKCTILWHGFSNKVLR